MYAVPLLMNAATLLVSSIIIVYRLLPARDAQRVWDCLIMWMLTALCMLLTLDVWAAGQYKLSSYLVCKTNKQHNNIYNL